MMGLVLFILILVIVTTLIVTTFLIPIAIRKSKIKVCTAETTGKIFKVKFLNPGRCIHVKYLVGNNVYFCKETVKAHSDAIKLGKILVGQRKIECIKGGISDTTSVMYDPNNPKKSYLKDNTGKYI